MDPQDYLDWLIRHLDPIVICLRAPAALVLFVFVCLRPQMDSRCIMLGRVLVLGACGFWMAAAIRGFESAARLGDYTLFASAFASHVCDTIVNWRSVMAARRAEARSAVARIWAVLSADVARLCAILRTRLHLKEPLP